jgi:hypothetical protein
VTERDRRWRLVLGEPGGEGLGAGADLVGDDRTVDRALAELYDAEPGRRRGSGLGGSAPNVARWLGDIRNYFPSSVVQVVQRDAVERLNLHRLLLEPELLAAVEPDVHLVATLLSLGQVMPQEVKATARHVVAGSSPRSNAVSRNGPGRPSPERWTARTAPAGRGRATSTSAGRSPRTSRTTCPSTAPSSPNG